MAKRYIDWERLEKTIFQKIAEGESLKAIAKMIKVSYKAILNWYGKKGVCERYDAFLHDRKLPDNRKKTIFKVTPQSEQNLPRFQNFCTEFKENLKVGDHVKSKYYNVKGTVIAKYPDIFTIRTEEGFLTSFGYNCFMDIVKG